jgi:YD repeat-containing protein
VSEYDGMGCLVKTTDPEGNETDYIYDLLGRLIRVDYADETCHLQKHNFWKLFSSLK